MGAPRLVVRRPPRLSQAKPVAHQEPWAASPTKRWPGRSPPPASSMKRKTTATRSGFCGFPAECVRGAAALGGGGALQMLKVVGVTKRPTSLTGADVTGAEVRRRVGSRAYGSRSQPRGRQSVRPVQRRLRKPRRELRPPGRDLVRQWPVLLQRHHGCGFPILWPRRPGVGVRPGRREDEGDLQLPSARRMRQPRQHRGHAARGLILCEDNSGGTTTDARTNAWVDAGRRYLHLRSRTTWTLELQGWDRTPGRARIRPGDQRQNEWAGACFSPDGQWLFVNIQTPGITFAITGPWGSGPL